MGKYLASKTKRTRAVPAYRKTKVKRRAFEEGDCEGLRSEWEDMCSEIEDAIAVYDDRLENYSTWVSENEESLIGCGILEEVDKWFEEHRDYHY